MVQQTDKEVHNYRVCLLFKILHVNSFFFVVLLIFREFHGSAYPGN